jgi:hypothetical protein
MTTCVLTLRVLGARAAAAETIPSLLNSFAKYDIVDETEVIWENLVVFFVNDCDWEC